MRALIFNSGTGSRMGSYASVRPKCLLEISKGTSILSRQIKCLISQNIHSLAITTGKYDAMIKEAVSAGNYNADFAFINNPKYNETNYIYSMYLARDLDFSDGVIMLHGDLVFDESVLRGLVNFGEENAVVVNSGSDLSDKDFNASVEGGVVNAVGVGRYQGATNILLPIYKLSGNSVNIWLKAVSEFIAEGKTGVYAENAFNTVSHKIGVKPYYIDIDSDFCMEVDEEAELLACRNRFSEPRKGNGYA